MKEKVAKAKGEGKKIVRTLCSLRGKKFEGYVIRKFNSYITIGFERVKYNKKYERYAKYKTKIHAQLPESLKDKINIGDYIQVMECRPISKIIHHVVVKKIRDATGKGEKNESN